MFLIQFLQEIQCSLELTICHMVHKISQLPTLCQIVDSRWSTLPENSLPEVRRAKLLFVRMLLRTQKYIVKSQLESKLLSVILNLNLTRLMMSVELVDIVCLEMALLKQKTDNSKSEAHIK